MFLGVDGERVSGINLREVSGDKHSRVLVAWLVFHRTRFGKFMQNSTLNDSHRFVLHRRRPSKGKANIVFLGGADDEHHGLSFAFLLFCIVCSDLKNERTWPGDACFAGPFSGREHTEIHRFNHSEVLVEHGHRYPRS